MKKETKTKIWMYWQMGFGLVCGLFACLGITAAADRAREYDERTYWAVLVVILLFFFKWGIEEYKKAREELKK